MVQIKLNMHGIQEMTTNINTICEVDEFEEVNNMHDCTTSIVLGSWPYKPQELIIARTVLVVQSCMLFTWNIIA